MRSTVAIFAFCLTLFCGTCMALCKDAQPGQIPHGANMLIVLTEKTVARLGGTVVTGNGEAAGNVVIEIYPYQGSAEETYRFVKDATRLVACITGADGAFAFDLKPGQYLLRAGTVEPAGMNEVHALFRVKWTLRRHKVQIRLEPGT